LEQVRRTWKKPEEAGKSWTAERRLKLTASIEKNRPKLGEIPALGGGIVV